jgi:hypothetical protein
LTMTNILRSLLKDSLGVKKYRRLLRSVGLRPDGSGGILFWDSLDRWYNPNTDHYSSLRQPFAAADNGGQLELLLTPKLKLLDLPDPVLERVFDIVLPIRDIRVVDVDSDTKFHDRLTHMNRWLYYRFGRHFFDRVPFKLMLSTSSNIGQFPEIEAFRKILRKTRPPTAFERIGRSCKRRLLIYEDYLVELDFVLNDIVSLDGVRADILPIIMESSTAYGHRRVTFRLSHIDDTGALTEIEVHHTTQRKLRTNIVKAQVEVAFNQRDHTHTTIWVNGFGDLVDVADQNNLNGLDSTSTTTRVIEREGTYQVAVLQPLDYRYRSDEGLPCGRLCFFTDLDEYFLVHGASNETLRYFLCVLEADGKRYKP